MQFDHLPYSATALALCMATAACAPAGSPRANPRATAPLPARAPAQARALARSLQLVVFLTPGWTSTAGTLQRFERDNGASQWRPVEGAIPAVIGRTGLAWSDSGLASDPRQPVKHEGDGKSPAGAFPLDTAFGFAAREAMSWLRMPYAPLLAGSDCVDDEGSAYYNTVVDRAKVSRVDWTSAEHMRQVGQYRIGVIVGYNAAPPQRGRGSCIFLHIWGGPSSTTAGCTALDAGRLEQLMRWLDAARRPAIVQLPVAEYARLRSEWRLPQL